MSRSPQDCRAFANQGRETRKAGARRRRQLEITAWGRAGCSGLLRGSSSPAELGGGEGWIPALGMDEIYTSLSVMNFAWEAGDGDGETE